MWLLIPPAEVDIIGDKNEFIGPGAYSVYWPALPVSVPLIGVNKCVWEANSFKVNAWLYSPAEKFDAALPSPTVKPILFLLSSASSYINGQTLLVDGGYTSW